MDERLQQVADHHLHQHLGITEIKSDSGNGSLSVTVSRNTVNPAGVFHGGVAYMLCDICAYAGLLSLIDDKTEAVTHDIHVSVMQSARRGDVVDFNSSVVRLGKRLCFIDVTASVAGKVIATARVTKSLLAV